jgi:hypothetical protein
MSGRICLRWNTPELGAVKMLAWVVKHREGANEQRLWRRVQDLCEPVIARVTGREGVTFDVLCEETLAAQGTPITPNKLMQRADKAERYCEWAPEKDAVVAAYEAIVARAEECVA